MRLEKRIGVVLLFALAGAVVMQVYAIAYLHGAFIQWENMSQPPSKPVDIIRPLYVRTTSDDIYQYVCESDHGCIRWTKVDPASILPLHSLPADQCGNLPSLGGYIKSQVVCEYHGKTVVLAVTAIDAKGDVYSWYRTRGGLGDDLVLVLFPWAGMVAGVICGLAALLGLRLVGLLKPQVGRVVHNVL